MLDGRPRRNAPAGHVEREMTRLFRAREQGGVPQWDLPHYFVPLYWDGARMHAGPGHVIAPSVQPDAYHDLLIALAGKDGEAQAELVAGGEPPTLYGYMLVNEAHCVSHDPGTNTELEERRYQRDRVERRFYQRPDAQEACIVMAADIDGRFWHAIRRRGEPRRIERMFWPALDAGCVSKAPGMSGAPFLGGAFPRTLATIGKALAVVLYQDSASGAPGEAEVVDLRAAASARADGVRR